MQEFKSQEDLPNFSFHSFQSFNFFAAIRLKSQLLEGLPS
ncbi:hypothetical protein D1BOALGB6SA_5806 [Olavius sp. associated proteobacterium Delta 1]|nr:hypothetical protein D1BOALGB6SA_5806 [Olavius sp. associated proteobacterium Delta 1]